MKLGIFISSLALLICVSCVKKTLVESSQAKVAITINWENMKEDEQHNTAIIRLDGKNYSINEGSQPDPIITESGTYTVYIYNTPAGITINGETASAGTDENGNIIPGPEIFYSDMQDITTSVNNITEVTLTPVQQMCQLTILLNNIGSDSIESISGILDNVAGSFNIKTQKEEDAGTVLLKFEENASIVNLFGIMGDNQKVILEMTMKDQTVKKSEFDVSSLLNDFNSDKTLPKTISIDLNPQSQIAAIINWEKMTDSTVTLKIGDKSFSITKDIQPEPVTVKPGNHDIYAYNMPVGITINGEIASVDTTITGNITSPGIFYATMQRVKTTANNITEVEITPVQQMRQLTINLNILRKDSISIAFGKLDGIAGIFNIKTLKEENLKTVMLNFTGNVSVVNLLGIIGDTQKIVLNIMKGDIFIKQAEIDVSEVLKDFNNNKTQPQTLNIEIDDNLNGSVKQLN